MTAIISQDASELGLEWIQGDPIALAFTVQNVDWSGPYTAQIRRRPLMTSELMGTLIVSATLNAGSTDFTLTMTDVASSQIPVGTYHWDLQQTGGVTRLKGTVQVLGQVTV